MATFQHIAPGVEIHFHQETEQFAMLNGQRVPDESWKEVDKNGHGHAFFNGKLPTLELVQTGVQYVGDAYDGCEIPITHYECLICREEVEPKYKISYDSVRVAGPPQYTLMIRAAIMDRELPVPEDDVPALVEILGRMFNLGR